MDDTRELYVTTLLADFFETNGLKTPLDLATAERLKPPQLLPRSVGQPEAESRREVQSAIRALREDLPKLPLRCCPDWRYRRPGIAKRTNRPHARQSPKTDVSYNDSGIDPVTNQDAGFLRQAGEKRV
jgi:hypothetical protein